MKKRIVSIILIAIMSFCSSNLNNLFANGTTSVDTDSLEVVNTNGFEVVLENEKFSLFYNSITSEIAIENKTTGKIRYSNPQDRESDSLANEQTMNKLCSQLVVYYYEDRVLEQMDSFKYSVKLNNVTARVTDNKLKVAYLIGEQAFSSEQLPRVITRSRMENDILKKLNEDEKELITNTYSLLSRENLDKESIESIALTFPSIKEHDIYVREDIQDYIAEPIWEVFQKAGYTLEDLEKDCRENGVENKYKEAPFFKIELVYSLDNAGFNVNIDPEKIEYSENYKPARIDLLPYFGAANSDTQGYLLIPDGSGAVINYNNGKIQSNEYWRNCFCDDSAISKNEMSPYREDVAFPIFAFSDQNGGVLATVDKGYETCGITADVAGKNSMYNHSSFFFDLFLSDLLSLGADSANNDFVKLSDEIFSEEIEVSYHLIDEYTTYYEFANIYRNQLIEDGILPSGENFYASNLNVEFIGAVGVKKNFLGLSYKTLDTATTYEQATEILNSVNVKNVDIKFTNAFMGGINQKSAWKLKTVNSLGSKKDLNSLKEKSNQVYFSYYALMQKKATKAFTARHIDGSLVKRHSYDEISRIAQKDKFMMQLSPSVLKKKIKSVIKSSEKSGVDALNILDLGYELNSDFNSKNYYDSYKTRLAIEEYLESLSENKKISVEKGNLVSLKYVDKIWNVPTQSSRYTIFDYDVPFFALVIRGSIPMVTSAINISSNKDEQFLKTAEIGGELQFSWIYDLPDNIYNNEEMYYDRYYNDTLKIANEYSNKILKLNEKIGNSKIITHEVLSEDFVKTEYENGIIVLVNYSSEDLVFENSIVPARDFVVESR